MRTLVAAALCLATSLAAQVRLPPYVREVLPNGVVLLVMPKADVPLVSIQLVVRGGTEADPADKAGLAAITGDALRRGTAKYSSEQFSREVDQLGASFDTGADRQSLRIRIECLSKDFETGLSLLVGAATTPTFPENEMKKLFSEAIDNEKAIRDSGGAAARTYFTNFSFSADHPYSNVPDELTVARITRADVLAFHKAMFVGRNMILTVAGDVQPDRVRTAVRAALGSVSSGTAYAPGNAPPLKYEATQVAIVDKPDATQTEIRISVPGIDRRHSDYTALWLVNNAFGGRITSILNDELRVNSGLTYGAYSQFDRDRLPGRIVISTFTATATTGRAVDSAIALLRKLGQAGITEEQLSSVKAYIKGTYPSQQLETADQLGDVLTQIELFGLNKGEVDDLFSRIDAVTLEKANEVARRYYGAGNFRMLLLGNAARFRDDVAKYDKQPAQVSISEPGLRIRKATAAKTQ